MASAATTPNLALPQWVATEKPERTDFNAAFLAIDGLAAPYSCRAYNSSPQAVSNASDAAPSFDSEYWDYDNMHSTSLNTSRITFNHAGIYRVNFGADWASNGTGTREIWIDGGSVSIRNSILADTASGRDTHHQVSEIIKVSAGDYITAYAWQNSGGSLNLNSVSFSAEYIRT